MVVFRGGVRVNKDKIAEEISNLDFTDVPCDNTDEAIFELAQDLYGANEEEANDIMDIVMNKYIHNIG